jgi:hypothetical protein
MALGSTVVLLAVSLVMSATPASAAGGTTVETAPLISSGQTVSGNTAQDSVISQGHLPSTPDCMNDEELWTINLVAGEQVLLKGQLEAPAWAFDIDALPPGVTDAQFFGSVPIAGSQTGSLTDGLSFAASKTGTWLIVVGPQCGGSDGPFQFTAQVTPAAFAVGNGGGTTVETAPLIASGQTVSGDTAQDSVITQGHLPSTPDCMNDEELWSVNLVAGDQVLLKGQLEAPAWAFNVDALPPGVTDAQFFGSIPIAGGQTGSLTDGLSFAASKTGTWLIVVGPQCGGSDGPFEFTAQVTQAAFAVGTGGGTTVETAPLLVPGQTVAGNTAQNSVITQGRLPSTPDCMNDEELWSVNLVAGDQVLLKGQLEAPAWAFDVDALPPGVTDAQFFGSIPIAGSHTGSLSDGLSFTASKTGKWLVVVGPQCGGTDGPYQLTATLTEPPFPLPVTGMASTPDGAGYWLVDSQGAVSFHGDAGYYGSMSGVTLNAPISHIVATPDGLGYWLVASDGGTFSFGDAGFYGSMGGRSLNAPVVDIAPTTDGKGYWLVASDGGIFAFGDAHFHGSMGGHPLNEPVVGIAADYATGGYWEVSTDGGIFAFGAPFYGSTGSIHLSQPVNGMTVTSDDHGYWFVASDGGIFAYGNARFHGSTGAIHLAASIVGMASDNATGGYWLVASDGGIFSYNAPFYGSA